VNGEREREKKTMPNKEINGARDVGMKKNGMMRQVRKGEAKEREKNYGTDGRMG